MNQRHKHADVIIAWANGEEVEVKWEDEWTLIDKEISPVFNPEHEYRIKPKRVKKEGWVNIYEGWVNIYSEKPMRGIYIDRRITSLIYLNKEAADEQGAADRIACIRIEWEEDA